MSHESNETQVPPEPAGYPEEVQRLEVDDREFILVGTAHVSRESAALVREVIERERPDHVAVELDEQRYRALAEQQQWEKLDLRQILRTRQLATLVVNLLLASFQKRLGEKLGVMPGTELLEAVRAAQEAGIPHSLADRDVRTTLLRAWRTMSLWQRSKLLAALLVGAFEGAEISEDELRELKKKDTLSLVIEELAAALPTLKRVLIDERDRYLAHQIRSAEGRRVVAVVGAGHLAGIGRAIVEDEAPDLAEITAIPEASPVWRWVGWSIPVTIVGSLVLIAVTQSSAAAGEKLVAWVLAMGIPASVGAALALAHPVTIVTAFVAAPITGLSPFIGVGHVTALVQAWVQPPRVGDFRRVTDDARVVSRWWTNRLLRVLLAFLLPSFGGMLGMYIGLASILRGLF